jgi:hypothetical protein
MDQQCDMKELQGVTPSGWLSYVLADPIRAQCVLNQTQSRAAALGAAHSDGLT